MYVTNLSVKLLWLCLPPPRHRLALEWGVCPNDNEAEIQIQMSLKDDNSSWREFGKFGTWDFSRYGIRRSSLTPDRSKMISINTTCIESHILSEEADDDGKNYREASWKGRFCFQPVQCIFFLLADDGRLSRFRIPLQQACLQFCIWTYGICLVYSIHCILYVHCLHRAYTLTYMKISSWNCQRQNHVAPLLLLSLLSWCWQKLLLQNASYQESVIISC